MFSESHHWPGGVIIWSILLQPNLGCAVVRVCTVTLVIGVKTRACTPKFWLSLQYNFYHRICVPISYGSPSQFWIASYTTTDGHSICQQHCYIMRPADFIKFMKAFMAKHCMATRLNYTAWHGHWPVFHLCKGIHPLYMFNFFIAKTQLTYDLVAWWPGSPRTCYYLPCSLRCYCCKLYRNLRDV